MATEYKLVKILLNTAPDQEAAFRHLQDAYRQACQFTSDYIFDNKLHCTNIMNTVFIDVFRDQFRPTIQEKFGFKCCMTNNLISHVCQKYNAFQMRLGGSRLTKPLSFRYSQLLLPNSGNVYRFHKKKKLVSIQLINAKPAHCRYDIATRYKYKSWTLNRSLLLNKNGKWYLSFLMQHEKDDFTPETVKHIVGIDLGLNYLMYFFDDTGEGYSVYSRQVLAMVQAYKAHYSALEQLDTDEARHDRQSLVNEIQEWKTEINHNIINLLKEKYGDHTLYVIEDINYDTAPYFRKWKFKQMIRFLQHMASETDSWVLRVPAHYTSQRCSVCGKIRPESRDRANHIYKCTCGFSCNDDLNAAMNIYQLGVRRLNGDKRPRFQMEDSDL